MINKDPRVEWVFPIEEGDDPELGYAMAHRTRDFRQRHVEVPRGPIRYIIGGDGLTLMEAHLPILRAFLKALDAAPQGTNFITCARCGCRTLWVYGQLRGTDNSGDVCDEHDCKHGDWNTRRDAQCRFCGQPVVAAELGRGVVEWLGAYDEDSQCPQSTETPAVHKPAL